MNDVAFPERIEKSAYLLIYESPSENVSKFIVASARLFSLLKPIKQIRSLKIHENDFTNNIRREEIIASLKKAESSYKFNFIGKQLQMGLEKENVNTADDIYLVFKALEYISIRYTSGLNPISLKMCISYFMICSRCKIESKQQCYPAVLEIDNLDENAIENSVGKISPKWQSICCKIGKKQFGSYVESLPEAFFLYLNNTEGQISIIQ